MIQNDDHGERTKDLSLVGVNFKPNHSLSSRYTSYLSSSNLTCRSTMLYTSPSCVVVATAREGIEDPLTTLAALAIRNGFSRCSGRMFAMNKLSVGLDSFYKELRKHLLHRNTIVRTHAHPQSFSAQILDYIDQEEVFKERNIFSSPTEFSILLVAVQMDREQVGWGLYTLNQYKDVISRPGDGNRLPVFDLHFNRAELKIAEAMQLLSEEETECVFKHQLLALDVGAAPGGWAGFLARHKKRPAVIAIDPAVIDPAVATLDNVLHLAHKAEVVSQDNGTMLRRSAESLMGTAWRKNFRLLVCDANLDIRDTLRELVLPLAEFLYPGGVLIVTIKLGRRVGEDGVARKEEIARKMLTVGGFKKDSIRIHWLFGNSKNERTIFAVKT